MSNLWFQFIVNAVLRNTICKSLKNLRVWEFTVKCYLAMNYSWTSAVFCNEMAYPNIYVEQELHPNIVFVGKR